MNPIAQAVIIILAEAIVAGLVNVLPSLTSSRRLKSIDATLKGLRRDLRRTAKRIDLHDQRAGIDTRTLVRLHVPDEETA